MKDIRIIFAAIALLAVSFRASAQWPSSHTDEEGYTVENYQNGRDKFGSSWGSNVTGKFIYHLGSKGNDQVAYTQDGTITLKSGAVFILEICTNDNIKWAWYDTGIFRPCFFVVESGAKLIVRRAPGYTGTLQFDGWAQSKGYECIRVHQGGVAEISNAKFVNFYRQTGTNVNDSGDATSNGHYERMGSAARVEGTLTLNDCEIWGGRSYMGGAVAAHQTGKIYINGGSIHDCVAGGRGGAVFVSSLNSFVPNSSGSPTDTHGTALCEIRGTKIYKNTAVEWGGGVYVWWKDSSLKLLADASGVVTDIYNNQTTNYGGTGMVVADYAEATLGGVKIHDHTITATTANRGAGIYVSGAVGGAGRLYTDITNGTAEIYNNKATTAGGIGGGIYCSSGSRIAISAKIYNNQAAAKGGGIYLANDDNSVTALEMLGGEITGNSCNEQGAGIYIEKGNIVLEAGDIKNNKTPSEGGGIYDNDGNIKIATAGIFTINGNEASSKGGGIYLNKGDITMLRWASMSGNKAGSHGGALYIGDGSFNGNGGTLSSNSAAYGGAIYIQKGALALGPGMDGGTTFMDNHASSDGGAIFMADNQNSVTIEAGFFKGNTAGNGETTSPSTWTGWGGAIYVKSSNSTVNVKLAYLDGNKASKGGAFYINASGTTVNISDIEIKNCNSTFGAAMFVEAGKKATVNLNGGTVHDNSTHWNGGAIFVDNDNTLNINGIELTGNRSTGGKGGAVFAKGSSARVLMTGGKIESNTALLGGGIGLIDGAVMTYREGGSIRYNRALKDVSNGSAGFGGGVWLGQENGSTGTATLNFVINTSNPFGFYGNYAETAGDDIYTTGDHTKISVPDISSMNLKDYPYAHDKLYWVEDYRESDPDYANGTRLNTTGPIERYRAAIQAFHPTYSVRNISTDASLQTKYLALVLGYELRTIKIRRQGLIPGENAIYFINSVSGNFKQKVLVRGTEADIDEVTIKGIPSGQYTVTESDWTWYKTDASNSAIVRTQWVESEPIFNFTNTHRPENTATVPVHDESMKAQ